MTTNVPLSRTPARRGSMLCDSGPIYLVSFYLLTRHNSLIITLGLRYLHTSIFIETPFLEGSPTKAKEDSSPHEMRLSLAGHQPSIYKFRGTYCYYYDYYYFLFLLLLL